MVVPADAGQVADCYLTRHCCGPNMHGLRKHNLSMHGQKEPIMISHRLEQALRRVALVCLVCPVILILAACGKPGGGGGSDGNGDANTNDNSDGFVPAGVARVYGRVLLASDESPLAGVRVTALDADDEAETDVSGRFVIELPAPGTYGVTTAQDGYTYAQRRVTVEDGDIVAVADMYLTVVDPATIRIGPEGGTGANSDGSIELEIPPGALNAATDMRATRYEGGRALPNFLPELSHFTYACDLTPDGLSFNEPVTVRMRNSRGFAPGTPVPIGVYDPDTLEWTHESMGTVSDDGQWLVFEAEHFSPRDCNLGRTAPGGSGEPGDAEDTSDEARTTRNNQPCGSVRSGSRVDVGDGHLMVDHVLPSYQTLEQPRSIALQYNSRRSDAGVSLEVSYDVSQTATAMPDRIRFVAEVGGNRVERFYEPIEGPMRFAYQWDGRDPMGALMPAGTYDYRLTLANEYRTTFATVSEFGGEAVVDTGVEADEYLSLESTFAGTVNFRPSDDAGNPLGYGWGIAGLYALIEGMEFVTISEGAGSVFMFAENGTEGFTPSRGDLSSLTRSSDGSFVWTRMDGTNVTFDTQGRQTHLADRYGNTTVFTYDDQGRLASVTDPIGKSTQLAYDGGGRLASVTDPTGRVTGFNVDTSGNLSRIVNPDGSGRRFSYDVDHHMISQTDAGGQITLYTYDESGAVSRVDRPDGSYTQHVAAFMAQPSYTDPLGNEYLFEVNAFGTRTGITDPAGRTAIMRRDEHDRLTSLALPSGKMTTFEYDERDNLTYISGYGRFGAYPDALQITYDSTLNLPLTIDDDVAGTWRNTYDDNGNLTRAIVSGGYTYTFTYNERGQRTTVTLAGATTAYTYDADGNLATMADPGGGTWTFTRDDYGNLTGVTNPDGRQWSAEFNVMNLIETVTNGAGDTVRFHYEPGLGSLDIEGNGPVAVPVQITDGRGNTTTFTYDQMYRVTEFTDASGNSTRFDYDAAGRVISRFEPTGARVDFVYDEVGQLTQKTLSSGESVTSEYDPETGLLTAMANGACRLEYSYNWYGLVDDVVTIFQDTDLEVMLSYEHRASTFQESSATLYVGDAWSTFGHEWERHRGWFPTDRFGGGYLWFYLTYDTSGRMIEWDESYSSLIGQYGFDAAGRLIEDVFVGAEDGESSWEYSPAGYRTRWNHHEGVHDYEYDEAGRLIRATHPTPDNPDENYSYDGAGNRRISGREAEFAYDTASRLLDDPGFEYAYDASGNLTRRTDKATAEVTTYSYDAENRLISVALPDGANATYAYDPLGRRCEKRVGSVVTRYVYDRDEVRAEFDESGNLLRQYVTGGSVDKLMAVKIGGFDAYENYIYTLDPLGTVTSVTDDRASVVCTYRYQAFGEPVFLDGVVEDARMFAGSEYDAETGMYYMRRRHYDPTTGRFLQRDSKTLGSAVAPYVYAGNNPVNARDPFGLEGEGGGYGIGSFLNDRVASPNINTLIGEGLGRATAVPSVVTESHYIPLPGAGAKAAFGTYTAWSTVIDVFGSDNPAEAGIDWYSRQPWNPASPYIDDFRTLGGAFPRREARIGRICGLREGLRDFFGF